MLSAFTAQPIVELKQRDKSKIESVLAYGDRLLIGLNTGSLRVYRVNEIQQPAVVPTDGEETSLNGEEVEAAPPKLKPVDLLREEEKFSRKPIQQLARVKEVGILVSLSDGYVAIHEEQTYALQERLERTRGATTFAVTSNIVKDAATGIPDIVSKLAVAVKRRLLVWSWQAMELSPDVTEIILSASIKSLNWASGTKIVVGMDPGFFMVDVESKEVTDIIKPDAPNEAGGQAGVRFGAVNSAGMGYMGMGGWVPKPMATKLGEGEMLLAKDVNTLFIDADGKPLEKRQVPWAQAPETIGYSYPYMLALQPPAKGGLEVRSPDTLSLLQTITVPNATLLHVPQPNISLAHAGKGFLVASDRTVWRMGALDYESQIDVLTQQGRFDEAISLLGMLEDTLLKDKEGRLREIKILKAQSLFESRKYHEAMDLFSEARAPPARVISLYPKVIAGDLTKVEEERSEEAEEESKSNKSKTPPASPKVAPQGSIGRSMFGRLMAEQKKPEPPASPAKPTKSADPDEASGVKRTSTGDSATQDKQFEGKDLDKAVNALFGFLAQTRVNLQKYMNADGTLQQELPPQSERAKGWRPDFSDYIQLEEHENTKEMDWQARLLDVARLADTTLFRAYMLKQPRLIGSLFRINNFCDPLVVRDKLDESGRHAELIDFLHGKKLHREALEVLAKFGKTDDKSDAPEDLKGPQRTIGYLQQLPPELIDIILEFAEWPLKASPEEGMQIFLADTENAETLPRHRVLDFLQPIDTQLAVQYLEHIIFELNDYTPDFHQRLIDLYLDRLRDKEKGFASSEEREDYRHRLEKVLRSSAQYHRGRVFGRLPADDPDFYESRAIVLSKMGNHKQALQIYVFQIQDYDKAEEYCNEQYLLASKNAPTTTASALLTPQADTTMDDAIPSIYHTLLSLYLSPPPPHKPNFPPALQLLSHHGARLPAFSTLDLLPSSLPIADLESYFRGRIRSATALMAEERIVSRLRGVEKARTEEKLVARRERGVVVGEERVCGVCYKRFGGSAVRVWPDGRVTHYGCVRGSLGKSAGLEGRERGRVGRLFS